MKEDLSVIHLDPTSWSRAEVLGQMRRAAQAEAVDVDAAERLAVDVAGRLKATEPGRAGRFHRLDAGAVARLIKG